MKIRANRAHRYARADGPARLLSRESRRLPEIIGPDACDQGREKNESEGESEAAH